MAKKHGPYNIPLPTPEQKRLYKRLNPTAKNLAQQDKELHQRLQAPDEVYERMRAVEKEQKDRLTLVEEQRDRALRALTARANVGQSLVVFDRVLLTLEEGLLRLVKLEKSMRPYLLELQQLQQRQEEDSKEKR